MIETEKCVITILENGIIRLETKENVTLNENDLIEIENFYTKKLKVEDGLFLIVFSKGLRGDKTTKKRFVEERRQNLKKAEAIVMNNIDHKIEASFYLKQKKANHPIKTFDNEKDAIFWLLLH